MEVLCYTFGESIPVLKQEGVTKWLVFRFVSAAGTISRSFTLVIVLVGSIARNDVLSMVIVAFAAGR